MSFSIWASENNLPQKDLDNSNSKVSNSIQKNPTHSQVTNEAAGQATYEQFCSVCHRDGIAGAPKFRDEADWQPRLEKQKLEGLVATAVKGLNAMPAKGTCYNCTEEDLKNAIQFMLPQP